jgi:hypothetical protein
MEIEKVKERISKLLAMAKDSSSPHEAAIAAKRARALMDKYQIEESNIEAATANDFGTATTERIFKRRSHWIEDLAVNVAKYNDVHVNSVRVVNGTIYAFKGFQVDADMALSTFNYLVCEVEQLCQSYLNREWINFGKGDAVRLGNSFRLGAAKAIRENLKDWMKERMEIFMSSGTSLVVAKVELVEEKFGKFNVKKVRWKEQDAEELAASASGYAAGKQIKLNKQLD